VTYVVDTHALVWFLEQNRRLGPRARAALSEQDADKVIPTIALAEIAYLYDRKRVRISVPAVLAHVARAPRCTIYSLDETVVERMPTGLNIHDALIVATALVFRDVLGRKTAAVTRDAEITASGLIDVVW